MRVASSSLAIVLFRKSPIKESEGTLDKISFSMEIELDQGYISRNPQSGDVDIRSKIDGISMRLSRREYEYLTDALAFCQSLEDTHCDQVTSTDNVYGEEIPLLDNFAEGRRVSVLKIRLWKDSVAADARRIPLGNGQAIYDLSAPFSTLLTGPAPSATPITPITPAAPTAPLAPPPTRQSQDSSEKDEPRRPVKRFPGEALLATSPPPLPYTYATKVCLYQPNLDRCTGFYLSPNDPVPTFTT